MKAIILAAGEGKRLQPITLNKPKPLLEIRGRSILENIIRILRIQKVDEIIVVTGYKSELFMPLQKKLNFKQVVFEDYKTTNSAESLKFVIDEIVKGTMVLNGDLFIINNFIEYFKCGVSQFLAQKIPKNPINPTWSYTFDDNGRLLDIDTNATSGWGEGIAFFDNEQDLKILKESLLSCNKEDYWEQMAINAKDKLNFYISLFDSFYTEIDCISDAIEAHLITPEEIAKQTADDGEIQRLESWTNINYKIKFLGQDKVLRIPRKKRERLLNPENEKEILQIIDESIVPKSEFYNNDIKISDFLDGYRPLKYEDINDKTLSLIVEKILALHSYSLQDYPNLPRISMRGEIEKYESQVGLMLVNNLEHKLISKIAQDLDNAKQVLCHRDLLGQNILYNGSEIRFVDFEYSGISSAIFELGNFSTENGLAKPQIEKLAMLYGDISYTQIIAGELMANYLWCLWSFIYKMESEARNYLLRFHKNLQYLMENYEKQN